jgi:hypothetical protein
LTWRDRAVWHSELVNTDKTEGYKGGILSLGNYYGIVGLRTDGKRVVKVFSGATDLTGIKSDLYVPNAAWVLPSDIPNPNHAGKKIITYVQVHAGGLSWDYSHGCITILNAPPYDEFTRLMRNLDNNEIIKIKLC